MVLEAADKNGEIAPERFLIEEIRLFLLEVDNSVRSVDATSCAFFASPAQLGPRISALGKSGCLILSLQLRLAKNWDRLELKAYFSKKPVKKIFSLLGGKIEFEFYYIKFKVNTYFLNRR